jgi:hypothetical protein
MLTGEMLHAAYREAVQARKAEHATKQETTDLDTRRAELAWEELSPQGQTLYDAMAEVLTVQVVAPLHAQIDKAYGLLSNMPSNLNNDFAMVHLWIAERDKWLNKQIQESDHA